MKNIISEPKEIQFYAFMTKVFPELKILKSKDNRVAFDKLMKSVVPDIKLYIDRELGRALKNGSIPSGKYNVADFVNELYIKAYDHFYEVKEDKFLYSWLFQKANELLKEIIIEEEFDSTFLKNIDNYSKLEWDEMEEKFSTDGDCDLVSEEELDDLSLSKSNYILESVFVEDNQKDLIEKLDKELTEERIYNHISMALDRLPSLMRTIFDLTVNQQFNLKEISNIKRITVQEANKYLMNTRRHIRLSFENRYL